MHATLTPQVHKTFRLLGSHLNLACTTVLARALESECGGIRLVALQTLLNRGKPEDMAAIVERIDKCTEAELPLLASHVPLLLTPIEAGLADRDPEKCQSSLVAIAKLQIAEMFHHLVRSAQSPGDAQQMVSAELLLALANKLGAESRFGNAKAVREPREQLLSDLWQSMLEFDDHKIIQIADAWLYASHWEDQAFRQIFRTLSGNTTPKIAIRQLSSSQNIQISELFAGVLWSNGPFPEAIQMLSERSDSAIAVRIAEHFIRFGTTPQFSKNLATKTRMKSLERFDFSDGTVSTGHLCALIQLLGCVDVTPDIMLNGIIELLEHQDSEVAVACAIAIRSLKSLKPEIVVMVLSDCFKVPEMDAYDPPPWKTSLRTALERLIELYPLQPQVVRSSIEHVFSDFRCEELLKHLDDWPESYLNAYAKMVRIAELGYVAFIEREATCQSQVKRSRAIHAVRYLGMAGGLDDLVAEALHDNSEKVRIEAIHSIASGRNRKEAIKMLLPLVQDEDQGVKTAANFAISQLGVE